MTPRSPPLGYSYGYTSHATRDGRTMFVADVHRDGKQFIVGNDGSEHATLTATRL